MIKHAQKNYKGEAAMGRLHLYGKAGNQACQTSETGEGLGVPSGDLDDEKSREEECWCI